VHHIRLRASERGKTIQKGWSVPPGKVTRIVIFLKIDHGLILIFNSNLALRPLHILSDSLITLSFDTTQGELDSVVK
jgi:hypothetical protein